MSLPRAFCLSAFALLGLLAGPAPVRAEGEVATSIAIQPVEPVVIGEGALVVVDLRVASGVPLADEPVALTTNGTTARRRTDENGSATFRVPEDLAPGDYTLTATYEGRRNTWYPSRDDSLLVVAPYELTVETVPPLPGMVFELDGVQFTADEEGFARITVQAAGDHRLRARDDLNPASDQRVEFSRWNMELFGPEIVVPIPLPRPLQAGFDVHYQAQQTFVDPDGGEVEPGRVSSITFRTSLGNVYTLPDGRERWYKASRTVRRPNGLESVDVRYNLEVVEVDGSNVVNSSQQRFELSGRETWEIELLLFSARLLTSDALFGISAGQSVNVAYPNGEIERVEADESGEISVRWLARGIYQMTVADAPGWSPVVPVALSRDQDVILRVVTYLDMFVAVVVATGVALGLLHIGRPHVVPGTAGATVRAVGAVGRFPRRVGQVFLGRPRADGLGARSMGAGLDTRPSVTGALELRDRPNPVATIIATIAAPPDQARPGALPHPFVSHSVGVSPDRWSQRPLPAASASEEPWPDLGGAAAWVAAADTGERQAPRATMPPAPAKRQSRPASDFGEAPSPAAEPSGGGTAKATRSKQAAKHGREPVVPNNETAVAPTTSGPRPATDLSATMKTAAPTARPRRARKTVTAASDVAQTKRARKPPGGAKKAKTTVTPRKAAPKPASQAANKRRLTTPKPPGRPSEAPTTISEDLRRHEQLEWLGDAPGPGMLVSDEGAEVEMAAVDALDPAMRGIVGGCMACGLALRPGALFCRRCGSALAPQVGRAAEATTVRERSVGAVCASRSTNRASARNTTARTRRSSKGCEM